MGSVSIDIHKKEREFGHLTLSDSNVVKYLILYRSKVDVGYGANRNINIYQAGDTFEFNQEIIALYASLDKTVEKSSLTKKQDKLIKLLYQGYTIEDSRKELELKSRVATYEMLDRIVNKIVATNNESWYYTTGHNGQILKSPQQRSLEQ